MDVLPFSLLFFVDQVAAAEMGEDNDMS